MANNALALKSHPSFALIRYSFLAAYPEEPGIRLSKYPPAKPGALVL